MTTITSPEVLGALGKYKNVLLYGPPGTGKTQLLAELVATVASRGAGGGNPVLQLGNQANPFSTAASSADEDEIPADVEVEWVTFHQSYSYEDFIVGRRPKPEGGGLVLEPHFGVLMTLAVKLQQANSPDAYLLIIDEINRANASQVFGEFITLLDPDYRETVSGAPNSKALKIRLPGISYQGGESEPIVMLRDGEVHRLPEDWTFPEHIYVLATMNSVDKAALPLDSALTRRFHRIEMAPDLDLIGGKLGVSLNDLAAKAREIRNSVIMPDSLTAEETSVLLLDRLNILIAADIGEDFELGHALIWPVVRAEPSTRWAALIHAWDHTILPQLMDRYPGQEDRLREILRSDHDGAKAAFSDRSPLGAEADANAPLGVRPLGSIDFTKAQSVLRTVAL